MSSRCSFTGCPPDTAKVSQAFDALAVADLEPALALLARAVGPALGIHRAAGLPLDVVVADRLRGVDRVGDLLLRRRLEERHAVLIHLLGHVADPRSREAVGLQLGAHAVAVGTRAVVGMLLHDPGDVLHVVAVLVREHVQLRERSRGRVEPLAQQREERRIDVDGLFGRAVEGSGLVRRRAALGRRRGVDDDELRLPVALDLLRPSTGRWRGMPRRAGSRRCGWRRHRSRSSRSRTPPPPAPCSTGMSPEKSLPVKRLSSRTASAPSPATPPPMAIPASATTRRVPPDAGVVIERHGAHGTPGTPFRRGALTRQ